MDEEELFPARLKKLRDVIDRIGLEHALEENHPSFHRKTSCDQRKCWRGGLFSKEKFLLSRTESFHFTRRKFRLPKNHSFLEWLKIKSHQDFGTIEEVLADEKNRWMRSLRFKKAFNLVVSKRRAHQSVLLPPNRGLFPSKVEFSIPPVNQAKKRHCRAWWHGLRNACENLFQPGEILLKSTFKFIKN